MHPGINRRGEWNLVWSSDTYAWDDTWVEVTTCTKWYTSDVESDGILSCDCGSDNDNSSEMVILRLSIKDK